jgi:2-phospho-L-lactate transferase/gluconeogenesis factor (CofD/UPF0052 family)
MADAALAVSPRMAGKTRIDVVLFSGGSGTKSIVEALLRHPQIRLRILINAYDDGHSTGRLRRFIPSMLGPSDVRKNIDRLMPVTERCHLSLKAFSNDRLPVGIPRANALRLLDAIAAADLASMPPRLAGLFRQFTVQQAEGIRSMLSTFLAYFHREEQSGRTFDFTDCALGNLLFAGCYLAQGSDFNRAIAAFSQFYEVAPDALLNVTQGENLFLVAWKEDHSLLVGEADIVAAQTPAKISDLYLVGEEVYRTRVEGAAEPAGGWLPLIQEAARIPRINPAVAEAIAEADVIVYGPGTQHSSLFPSYLTQGLAEAIARNRTADKIFIGNILRDLDIQTDDVNDLARKFMGAMTRQGQAAVEWSDCVTQLFVQRTEEDPSGSAKYIPFDPAKFLFPMQGVRIRDWESQEGHHSGGFVLDELQQIVQSRIDIELQRIQHMVSIVVPVLNEARTLEEVLKSLLLLDFQPLGITKEIIVVDGGSTDGSFEIAQSVRTVRAYRSPPGAGRGAAMRAGIKEARGGIVAFFAADREYLTGELYLMVRSLVQSNFRAVFGSRAIKVRDLSAELKSIYEGKRGLYLTSKYGGMLLSIVTLLLYNRYITDVLTSVKAFDVRLLRSLLLEGDGRNLDTEIIAKLCLLHEYILEIPVSYSPRTRSEGKKITLMDGMSALAMLFRQRILGNRAAVDATVKDQVAAKSASAEPDRRTSP